MKYIVCLVVIFDLLWGVARGDSPEEKTVSGSPYFTQCTQAMDILTRKDKTIEEQFVEGAKTKEQMVQLVLDYGVVFSENFLEAFNLTLADYGLLKEKATTWNIRALQRFGRNGSLRLNRFIWKALDRMVDLRSQGSTAMSQIRYLQAKNLIAALKNSANRGVFEDIMRTVVRFAILERVNTLVHRNGSLYDVKPTGLRFGISATMMATFTGIGYAISPDPAIMGALVGGIVGAFSGAIFFVATDEYTSFYRYIERRSMRKQSKVYNTLRNSEFHFTDGISGRTYDSVFKFLNKGETVGVLSVKDACNAEVCNLTPVQIAYLGHIDVLELEGLNKILKTVMKNTDVAGDLERISTAARMVYEGPTTYSQKMNLRLELSGFLEKMQSILLSRSKAVNNLNAYVAAMSQADLESLAAKPYAKAPSTRDEVAKNQLLISKIELDLKTLEDIRVNNQALALKIQKSQGVVAKLTQLLEQLPQSKDGWEDAAAEVISSLDELR